VSTSPKNQSVCRVGGKGMPVRQSEACKQQVWRVRSSSRYSAHKARTLRRSPNVRNATPTCRQESVDARELCYVVCGSRAGNGKKRASMPRQNRELRVERGVAEACDMRGVMVRCSRVPARGTYGSGVAGATVQSYYCCRGQHARGRRGRREMPVRAQAACC